MLSLCHSKRIGERTVRSPGGVRAIVGVGEEVGVKVGAAVGVLVGVTAGVKVLIGVEVGAGVKVTVS